MDESEHVEARKVFVKRIAKEVATQLGLPAAPTIIFDVKEWRKLRRQRKHPWHITMPAGQACEQCAAIFIPLPEYEFSDWRSWASLADFTKHEVTHLRFPSDDRTPYFEEVLKRVLAGEQFPSPKGKRQLEVCKRLIKNNLKVSRDPENSWAFCFEKFSDIQPTRLNAEIVEDVTCPSVVPRSPAKRDEVGRRRRTYWQSTSERFFTRSLSLEGVKIKQKSGRDHRPPLFL